MTDEQIVNAIKEFLRPIHVATDFKDNYWLYHNTSKKDCWRALYKIKSMLIKEDIYDMYEAAYRLDINGLLQHVSSDPEIMGYGK